MSKYTQISDLLQSLARFRKEIEFLFRRRNQTVKVDELTEFLDDNEGEVLQKMKDLGFILIEQDRYVLLNQDLEDFLENMTDISEDINNEYIRGKMQALKDNMIFYEKADFPDNQRYLEKIRKIVRELRRDINSNALQLKNQVQETYETEPNFNLKKEKLEVFKRKLEELIELKNEFLGYFESEEWNFFKKKANDEYLNYLLLKLDQSFTEAENMFFEINQKIVDYHNWFREQKEFVKKIKRLKEVKDRFSAVVELTNFEDVIRYEKTFFLPNLKIPSALDLDFIETDEFFEIVKKLRVKNKSKLKPIKQTVSENIIRTGQVQEKKVDYVNYNRLWQKFQAQGSTTFEFFFYQQDIGDKSKFEKINIYVKFISLYFSSLEKIDYQHIDEFVIADFKLKRRK